jgi:hypothetical protein
MSFGYFLLGIMLKNVFRLSQKLVIRGKRFRLYFFV